MITSMEMQSNINKMLECKEILDKIMNEDVREKGNRIGSSNHAILIEKAACNIAIAINSLEQVRNGVRVDERGPNTL